MNTNSRTCTTCGSNLILVSKVTEKLDGSRFPQTSSVYRCSNVSCQDEKDKEASKRLKGREEKEIEAQRRIDSKAADKLAMAKLTASEKL